MTIQGRWLCSSQAQQRRWESLECPTVRAALLFASLEGLDSVTLGRHQISDTATTGPNQHLTYNAKSSITLDFLSAYTYRQLAKKINFWASLPSKSIIFGQRMGDFTFLSIFATPTTKDWPKQEFCQKLKQLLVRTFRKGSLHITPAGASLQKQARSIKILLGNKEKHSVCQIHKSEWAGGVTKMPAFHQLFDNLPILFLEGSFLGQPPELAAVPAVDHREVLLPSNFPTHFPKSWPGSQRELSLKLRHPWAKEVIHDYTSAANNSHTLTKAAWQCDQIMCSEGIWNAIDCVWYW